MSVPNWTTKPVDEPMSLWDRYALAALSRMACLKVNNLGDAQGIARLASGVADAMMVERAKRVQP